MCECCVDLSQLLAFMQATQPKVADALDLEHNSPTRHKFLARMQGEISNRVGRKLPDSTQDPGCASAQPKFDLDRKNDALTMMNDDHSSCWERIV